MTITISRLTKLGRIELTINTNNIGHSLLSDYPNSIQEITDAIQSILSRYTKEKNK